MNIEDEFEISKVDSWFLIGFVVVGGITSVVFLYLLIFIFEKPEGGGKSVRFFNKVIPSKPFVFIDGMGNLEGKNENPGQLISENPLEKEIKDILVLIGAKIYPKLEGINTLTYSLLNKKNSRSHTDYTFATQHMNVYNVSSKTKEELLATSLHSLSHHLEYLQYSNASHGKRFYKIFYRVICEAMELGVLDYEKAKAQKFIDSADIQLLEKYFGQAKVLTKKEKEQYNEYK